MKEVSSGALLFQNKKLLIARPRWDSPYWNIPKGKMNSGETYWQTAIREVKEESNIDITLSVSISDLGLHKYIKRKDIYLFAIILNDNHKFYIKCNSFYEENGKKKPEMVDYKWIDLNDTDEYLSPNLSKVVNELKSKVFNFINNRGI